MRREDCVELFRRIPEPYHPQINLVMRNQGLIAVDVLVRAEPTYLVIRGREGGSTDEGRAFFLPYDEIAYVRVERVLKLGEIKRMYGEAHDDVEDKLGREGEAETARVAAAAGVDTPGPVPGPSLPTDPASIAKQNLLDRIRSARVGATGKLK